MANTIKHIMISKFPALKHRNFRIFLAGQCVSLIGTWLQRAAQQWFIYELTKSPFMVGLVGVFQFTPTLLFSLFAGVYVDRFPKRKLLIVTQSIQMLQALALAGLIWSHVITYWHVLILAAVLGLANTFDMPTRQSFFKDLVGPEDLGCAIGMNSTIVNLARIIGPALGGLFILYFGAGLCFFINGISFFAVLISLLKIKAEVIHIRIQEHNIIHEIKDGLIYMYKSNILFEAIISMLIIGTIAMNSDVIMPVFAKEVFKQQASGYSIMLSAMGVGSLLGSVLFAGSKNGVFNQQMLFKTAFLLSLFLTITGLLHNYYFALLSLAGVGFFNVLFMATVNSTIQLNSKEEFRGRAMGVYSLVFTGTTPFGNFFTGIITQNFGANAAFLTCGMLSACMIIILLLCRKRIDSTV